MEPRVPASRLPAMNPHRSRRRTGPQGRALAALGAVLAAAVIIGSCVPGPGAATTTTPGGSGTAGPGGSATAPGQTPPPGGSVSPGASAPPAESPSPVATPAPGPPTEQEAVALVLAEDPRFTGIGKRDPNLIGQGSWYEVRSLGPAFEVTVRIGWGDCPAGCISHRTWVYSVGPGREVRLVREFGDELPAGGGVVVGLVTAGPVCPVERDPPDPACAPRPVAGAILVFRVSAGQETARVTTGPDGRYEIRLAPGAYELVPQPVEGLMGAPEPTAFRVTDVPGEIAQRLDVAYDTGIR